MVQINPNYNTEFKWQIQAEPGNNTVIFRPNTGYKIFHNNLQNPLVSGSAEEETASTYAISIKNPQTGNSGTSYNVNDCLYWKYLPSGSYQNDGIYSTMNKAISIRMHLRFDITNAIRETLGSSQRHFGLVGRGGSYTQVISRYAYFAGIYFDRLNSGFFFRDQTFSDAGVVPGEWQKIRLDVIPYDDGEPGTYAGDIVRFYILRDYGSGYQWGNATQAGTPMAEADYPVGNSTTANAANLGLNTNYNPSSSGVLGFGFGMTGTHDEINYYVSDFEILTADVNSVYTP